MPRLVDRQPGRDDESVEAIALDASLPDGEKCLPEPIRHLGEHDRGAALGFQAEVVDHHRALAFAVDADRVRHLVDDAESEVLEDRQRMRQHDRLVPLVRFQAELHVAGGERPVERQAELPVGERQLDRPDIGDRLLGVEALAVAERKSVPVTQMQSSPFLFAECRLQCRQQMVGPGVGSGDDFGFEILDVEGRDLARRRLDDDVQSGERRVADLHVVGGQLAGEGALQDRLNGEAKLRRVAVPRHEHEAAHEAVEVVAAQEQRHPLPLLQMQDAEGHVEQLVVRDLKQFVARERLDDVGERTAVVAARLESRALQHPCELAAQQRDIAGAAIVRGGREQPGEHMLAAGPALFVEALDDDRVHVHRAVHRRLAVRLAHRQHLVPTEEAGHGGRYGCAGAQVVEHQDGFVAQQPETAGFDPRDPDAGNVRKIVGPVAEEGEIVLANPFEEGTRLGDFGCRDEGGVGRQPVRHFVELAAHGQPVVHRRADVGEDRSDARGDAGERADRLTGNLEVHERLEPAFVSRRAWLEQRLQPTAGVAADRQDGMNDQVDAEIAAVELGRHRIRRERACRR